MLERDPVDDGDADPPGQRGVERAAVTDAGCAVGQDDVGARPSCRPRVGPEIAGDVGPAPPPAPAPPRRVDRVGPHGVVQPLAHEVQVDGHSHGWRPVTASAGGSLGIVESEARA